MEGSLKLHLYGVKLKNEVHSVVEFASPIIPINDEEGKITNFRLNGNWNEFIIFKPGGYYRPILNNHLFDQYPNNEKYNYVSTLDEILYFPMDPKVLELALRMTLFVSWKKYNLQIEIVQKGNDGMNLKLLACKFFPRWKTQIEKRFFLYSYNENVLDYEFLKLNQSDFIMKRMVESCYKKQKEIIEKTPLTPIQSGITYFHLQRSLFLLKEFIYSVSEIFKDYFSRRGIQLPKYRKTVNEEEGEGGAYENKKEEKDKEKEEEEEEEKKEDEFSKFLSPIKINNVQHLRFARREEEEEEQYDEISKKDFTNKLQSIMGKLKANISEEEIFDSRCCV